MSKGSLEFKDGKLVAGLDTNEDGQNVLEVKISMTEALEEVLKREDPKEGVKIADLKMDGAKLILKVDTDKDGEELLDLVFDLSEGLDEVSGAFKK